MESVSFNRVSTESIALKQLFLAGGIVYNLTVLFIKLSLVLLYSRIFAKDKTMNLITYGLVIFLVSFYIAQTGVTIAMISLCTSASSKPSFCSDLWNNTIVQACINLATDFFVLGLPIVKVFHLHMPLRKKVGVSAIFGIGLL